MNIDEMNEHEKSAVLFELIGASVDTYSQHITGSWYQSVTFQNGNWFRLCDDNTLYNEKNMALAWRVLNWAHDNQAILSAWGMDDYQEYFFDMWELTPAEAQTKWLDEILELAIEAGMVKRITITGTITGIDTSAFKEGDKLYFNADNSGELYVDGNIYDD